MIVRIQQGVLDKERETFQFIFFLNLQLLVAFCVTACKQNTVIYDKALIAKAIICMDHYFIFSSLHYFEREIYTWSKYVLDQHTEDVEKLKLTS